MAKHALYKKFLSRLDDAFSSEMYLEASWYAYAVLEDRLVSMLENSGGVGEKQGGSSGKPIRMMGPKLKELSRRAKKDNLLNANFEYQNLNTWKESRNNLMHAMGDATMSIEDIDAAARKLAEEGRELIRVYAAACRRLKKHRAKFSA